MDMKKIACEYTFTCKWSAEDGQFIAGVAEFPSVQAHGETRQKAVEAAKYVLADILADMTVGGEDIPAPGRGSHEG